MDAPTPQTWGLGLKPKIRSWVGVLRAPIPFQREPAWHRVPTEYLSLQNTNLIRTVMRRICHPQPRLYGTPFLVSGNSEIAATKRLAAWTEPTKCKMPPKKSPRLKSFKPNEFLIAFCGGPDSVAETTHLFMKAKVDIANGILEIDTELLRAELRFLQTQTHRSTIPAKRGIDGNDCIERRGLWGGYKLITYTEVLHLIRIATNRGGKRITFLEGSITDVAYNFKEMGCTDHRVRISQCGIPKLHDIADKTEPLSMLELDKFQDESGRSPTKKSPLPTEPLKASPRHLSDTVVKLMPAASPQVAFSPVKSPGSPSTPFVDSPSSIETTRSPSPLAPVIAYGSPSSPLADIPCLSPGPTKHFCAPSYDSSSHSLNNLTNLTSSPHLSPAKVSETIAQTPSKVSKTEPSTPFQTATPEQNGKAGLGLVESIPTSTPMPDQSSLQAISSVDSAQLKFGPSTSSFNAPTWLSSTITSRAKQTTKKITRRKSEPVTRSLVRTQAARRQTISPRKYDFTSEGVFDTATIPAALPVAQHEAASDGHYPVPMNLGRTPEKPASSEPTSNMTTPAITWGKMTGRKSGGGVQSTPAPNRARDKKGMRKIDVRRHPNIFRAAGATPVSSPPAINRLAEMAVEGCDGQAKVMVTEENGRLVVRFKLPTEYAYLFPNSRGMDESRFTTTPSDISSSPRITFKEVHELPLTDGQDSPRAEQAILASSMHNEDTSAVPDLATSPVVTVEENQAPSITTPSPETKLNTSFTPVNQSTSHDEMVSQTSRGSAHQEPHAAASGSSTQHGNQPALQNHYEDSPGRDYMRDFIKRTHRNRLSTTETGSPIAPPVRRAPLGIKSPNVESPQKGKRKADTENQDSDSSLKTSIAPLPKKVRRVNNPGSEKKSLPDPKGKAPEVGTQNNDTKTKSISATNGGTTTNKPSEEEKAETGTGYRRSTRLRGQQPGYTAKSSIPTPINLRGRSNSGRAGFNHTRNEEKELSNKTRKNTLKNRGNAEYPAQVLAKYQEQGLDEESSEENRDPEGPTKGANGRKCVGWKTPLEAHQDEDAKKSRIATMKGKDIAKASGSGIARPTRTTTAQKQQRNAKVAATLGMSQNGTPAKPSRVTRSSTRART
ncbi:hypothetical protein MAC_01704 [Metarhizium acridum CQMa 102]|uniref:Uncharacterized protein n=1 Tax=Metarhizium acridum (strain CQMa 102) TaxID=655827 RepID=E9DVQ6_METAQ|nr:uncharacterized protein MAC_01704 [Metarhizium acridum CQMa 102]EFY92103.1 hypothetical protein MAC_01704 [Metarhizium acridum CQMa 102]